MGREGRGGEGGGSIDTQLGSCKFLGGEGGEGRGGRGLIDTQLGSCDFLGGEGGEGRGGGVNWHSTWKLWFLRWGGRGGEGRGGWSTLNLERIRNDFGRIASANTDPGGRGVDQHSTWKGSTMTLEGSPLPMLILGGGRSTLNLERIRKDFGRIALTWKGSANTLEGSPQLGKDLQWLWKDHLNLEGSAMTLEGLPQLGKDLQWLWKDCLNLERICNDFGRITSANADPGGVDRHSTWKGSTMTLEGSPLPMLILGGVWSTLNLERIHKDFGRIASTWKGSAMTLEGSHLPMLILGGVRLTLNLERIHNDFGRIASANADPGGVNQHSTWKGSTKTLEGLPQLGKDLQWLWNDRICQCWSWGGQLTLNLERIHNDFGRITSANADPGGSIDTQLGKDPQWLWKDRLCQCWSWGGQSTLNLERIHNDFGRITSVNADPGGVDQHSTWKGSAKTLEGLPQLGKDPQWLWKDRLCQYWSWGGVDWHSTWKGSAMTLEGLPLPMLILRGGRSTLNLERIHNDFGRITSANADPGGVNRHSTWKGSAKTLEGLPELGKDLQWLWKDRLCQCWSWGGVNWHSTWNGSAMTLEGSSLPMLILGGVDRHSTWKGSAMTLEGSPLPMLILGGGQLTLNLERIHKDFARITSTWKGSTMTLEGSPLPMLILGGGFNWHSTWKGSAMTLEGLPQAMLILGGSIDTQLGKDPQWLWKDCLCQCWSWQGGFNQHSTWKGSAKTLEGSPQLGKDPQWLWKDRLCQCWSWGGSIDTQLGKDPQRLWKDCLNLEMIHNDFGRIASANADPGGGVDWLSTWKGSTMTLEGSPLPMLILGGVNRHSTWKGSTMTLEGSPLPMLILGEGDRSTLNLERIHNDFGRITSANADPGGGWSTLNLERICKDFGRIASTWKGSAMTLEGLPQLGKDPQWLWKDCLNLERIRNDFGRIASANADPGGRGGRSTLNLERIHNDFGRIASANADPGGVDRHSTLKGSAKTLEGSPQLGKDLQWLWKDYLNLERIRNEFGRIASTWKGSTMTLEGSPLPMLILGGVDRHSTWKGSAMTLEGSPLPMLILGGMGGQSTLNLERICKDFGRITSTWKGSAKTLEGSPQLGKDLQRLWKDCLNLERIHNDFGRIASANADPGRGVSIDTQLGKDLQRLWKDRLNLERIRKDFGRIASTWKGSAMTLEGSPQLGKDPQWLWKDRLNLERIRNDFGRIASANADPGGGSIDTQLRKDPQCLWKDCLCQCWSLGGVNRHTTWKGSPKTLEGSPLPMLILGAGICPPPDFPCVARVGH